MDSRVLGNIAGIVIGQHGQSVFVCAMAIARGEVQMNVRKQRIKIRGMARLIRLRGRSVVHAKELGSVQCKLKGTGRRTTRWRKAIGYIIANAIATSID